MKALIVIIIIFLLFGSTCIRIRVYKEIYSKINFYLIISNSFRIKIDLTNFINKKFEYFLYDTSSETKIIDIKKSIELFRYHKDLIKDLSHIFNGNVVYLSINSFYYLDNLNYYLAVYYLYSYIQNLLYINLNKVKSTCFKTRVKNTKILTEVNVDIETYVFKIIYIIIKRRKELLKIKEKFYEQSSNNRIIKNIDVKH